MPLAFLQRLFAANWLGPLRRPVPRRVAWPVLALALALLAAVLAARCFPAGRQALWTAWRTIFPGTVNVTIDLKQAEARLRARAGAELALPLAGARVVIHKQARRLELFAGDRLVKTCAITLGRHPEGTKTRQGDGATPEGRYFICTRNGRSRFHLFLGLSYPGPADAAQGVKSGLVTPAQAEAIAAAEAARRRPAWDTRLGGEVGIHGGGLIPADWTFGCIAVADPDIEELWLATEFWTPVEIRP